MFLWLKIFKEGRDDVLSSCIRQCRQDEGFWIQIDDWLIADKAQLIADKDSNSSSMKLSQPSYREICAKLVPKVLTDEANRILVSLLPCWKEAWFFITANESWVRHRHEKAKLSWMSLSNATCQINVHCLLRLERHIHRILLHFTSKYTFSENSETGLCVSVQISLITGFSVTTMHRAIQGVP